MSDRTLTTSPAMLLTLCSLLLTPLLSACGTKTALALPERPAAPTLLDGLLSTAARPIATQPQAPVSSASLQETQPIVPTPAASEAAPSASGHGTAITEGSPALPSTATPSQPPSRP